MNLNNTKAPKDCSDEELTNRICGAAVQENYEREELLRQEILSRINNPKRILREYLNNLDKKETNRDVILERMRLLSLLRSQI